jgi:hypothetical protein
MRWTPCCVLAGFPCSSVLPCAYFFLLLPFSCQKKSKEVPHTLNMSWLDLNAPIPVEEEEADAPVLVEEEADALGFNLNVLPLDNNNGNDLNSFVSIFLCHLSCSMLPLDRI